MGQYRITAQARRDLLTIWRHIALDNEPAADRQLDRFHETFRLLASQPMMGEDRGALRTRLRALGCGSYVVYYEPIKKDVRIVRVIHGARDVSRLF